MKVEISDWQLIRELEQRIEAKRIFRANNGKLWPKVCPVCGSAIREYVVGLNFSPKDMEMFSNNLDAWMKCTREMLDKEDLYLPDLPLLQNGRFYYVRCSNRHAYFRGCPVANHEWFRDPENARVDFYNAAEEVKKGGAE